MDAKWLLTSGTVPGKLLKSVLSQVFEIRKNNKSVDIAYDNTRLVGRQIVNIKNCIIQEMQSH